jgi:hypothetical protein
MDESYMASETRQNHTWLSRAFLARIMWFLFRISYTCWPFSGRTDVLHAARLSARLRVSARVCSKELLTPGMSLALNHDDWMTPK